MAVIAAAVTVGLIKTGRYILNYSKEYYEGMINRLETHKTNMDTKLDTLTDLMNRSQGIWTGEEAEKARRAYQTTRERVSLYNTSIGKNIDILKQTQSQMNVLNGVSDTLGEVESAISQLLS